MDGGDGCTTMGMDQTGHLKNDEDGIFCGFYHNQKIFKEDFPSKAHPDYSLSEPPLFFL